MAILPAEYQQVEYIQSSGTQYIDTWISANQYLSFEADFAALWSTQDTNLFGARSGSTTNRFWLTIYNNLFHFMVGNTGTWNVTLDTNRHKASVFLDNWNFTSNFNWTTGSGSVWTSVYVDKNFLLFKIDYNSQASCPMKLYSFKLYEWKSTLVRDFLPCYRKSDGVIWLYDVVNNQFYTNSWTWTFIKWPDKVLKVKAVYLWNYRLPIEYREVEYIRNSWTQYIDTGYYPNDKTTVQAKFIYTNYNWGAILGGSGNGEADQFRFFRYQNNTYLDYGSWNGYNRIYGSYITSTTDIYEVEFGNRYIKDIPTDTVKISWSTVSFSAKSYTFKILEGNGDFAKMYYVKIYDNWTLVRDLVPCYRVSDGEIWMYDLVNDVFYSNAWTGTFTKWEEILPYVKIRPKESWWTLSGYWDFTSKSQADLQTEWWAGQWGWSWSVSGNWLTTSRSTTDRSYMVGLPIQINTNAKSIRIYWVINRTVGSWYGNFQWGIKATNTCGSGRDDYPADDWLIAQSVNCNNNSWYMGYSARSSWSVLNCWLPWWNSNLGYSGDDLAVEAIIDIESWEISATWKSWGTTIQSWTSTFDSATVRSALSGLSTNQHLSIFTRNGTWNYKYVKNLWYEIIY